MGAKFGEKLREMCRKHPSVGDVRGRGLLWSVELVKDQKKTPFNTQAEKLAGKAAHFHSATSGWQWFTR